MSEDKKQETNEQELTEDQLTDVAGGFSWGVLPGSFIKGEGPKEVDKSTPKLNE